MKIRYNTYQISKLKAENEFLKDLLSRNEIIRSQCIDKIDELSYEIKHIRDLIKEWADTLHHDEEPYDGKVYLDAQNNLRKVIE